MKFENVFINTLITKLNDLGLKESTVKKYISNLIKLNNDKVFYNLTFLNDVDGILDKIHHFKNNTQMSYIGTIITTLKLFKKYKNLRPNLEHNSEQFRISQTDKSGKRTYGRFRTLQEQYDLMGSQAEVNPKYEDTNATMARAKEKMEKNPYTDEMVLDLYKQNKLWEGLKTEHATDAQLDEVRAMISKHAQISADTQKLIVKVAEQQGLIVHQAVATGVKQGVAAATSAAGKTNNGPVNKSTISATNNDASIKH